MFLHFGAARAVELLCTPSSSSPSSAHPAPFPALALDTSTTNTSTQRIESICKGIFLGMTSLGAMHKALVAAFSSPASKPEEVRTLLTKLKIGLTEHNLLVPSVASSASKADLEMARSVLEMGAFYSVRIGDIPGFDRYLSLLTPFYDSTLSASENYEPLLGLRLLRLLSSNQISAFHTLIETLPTDLVNKSTFLQHPVSLERWLMEGSYSKVWRLSREKPPQHEYAFFVDLLMDMIRNEIASCEEKAYDHLALHDAATLLFFENLDQVLAFAQTVSPPHPNSYFGIWHSNVLCACFREDGKSTLQHRWSRSRPPRLHTRPTRSRRRRRSQPTSSLQRNSSPSSKTSLPPPPYVFGRCNTSSSFKCHERARRRGMKCACAYVARKHVRLCDCDCIAEEAQGVTEREMSGHTEREGGCYGLNEPARMPGCADAAVGVLGEPSASGCVWKPLT